MHVSWQLALAKMEWSHKLLSSGKPVREIYTPFKPLFYIVKLEYTGVYLFFLLLLQNIDCGYSLEPSRRGGSNVYPQSMFRAKIRKKKYLSDEIFIFYNEKKSLYIAWASFRNVNKDVTGRNFDSRRIQLYFNMIAIMLI